MPEKYRYEKDDEFERNGESLHGFLRGIFVLALNVSRPVEHTGHPLSLADPGVFQSLENYGKEEEKKEDEGKEKEEDENDDLIER